MTNDKQQSSFNSLEDGKNVSGETSDISAYDNPASGHTELVKKRYDRIALLYDLLTARAGWFSSGWRRKIWAEAQGKILDAGVGTGKNIPFYPTESTVTAVDLSSSMLEKARRRAEKFQKNVSLQQMNILELSFADSTFDSVVTTFVLSALPDPAVGLQELKRVLKPGGKLLIAEYAPPRKKTFLQIKKMIDSTAYYFFGPLKQVTVEHLRQAGLENYREEQFWPYIARLWIIHKT